MLTIAKIKNDFSYIKAWTGNLENYHDSPIFDGFGDFCDLYFRAKEMEVKQEQVDKYNDFRENFMNYIHEIESYILNSLRNSELNLKDTIKQAKLTLDVIEVPFDNFKYDLVLLCGKTYKKFFFFTRNIDIRVEFRNGKIQSIRRTKDIFEDNE